MSRPELLTGEIQDVTWFVEPDQFDAERSFIQLYGPKKELICCHLFVGFSSEQLEHVARVMASASFASKKSIQIGIAELLGLR